jgi:hypothetical protein
MPNSCRRQKRAPENYVSSKIKILEERVGEKGEGKTYLKTWYHCYIEHFWVARKPLFNFIKL